MSIADASTLPVAWWKSSRSNSGAQCVEFGILTQDEIAVRDSKHPAGPALLFTREQMRGFVAAARDGHFG